jgi:vancomycin resistance protein YoaR
MPPGEPEPARRRAVIGLLAGTGGLVVLGGAAYLALVLFAGDQVPQGTTVAGVEVGGLGQAEVEQRLREQLAPRAERTLRASAGEHTHDLDPAKAGLAFDLAGTVEATHAGRTFNPITLLTGMFGGGEPVRPVVTVDEERLDKTLEAIAGKVQRKPREGGIEFQNGEPKATMPTEGEQLDTEAARSALQAGLLAPSEQIELPTTVMEPEISRAEIERTMTEFAAPAMSGPLTLMIADHEVSVRPGQIGSALRLVEQDGKLVPELDGKALRKAMSDELDGVLTEAKDATIELTGDSPTVVPGRPGTTVPSDELSTAVLGVLTKTGVERVADVPVTQADPKVSTKDAEAYGVEEVVGEFSTEFPHEDYRNINIGRAAELINGTLIKPDGTFSLNDIVGERTEANGFTTGYVIKGGRLREELGGGVSQVATTTYNAAFFAGMADVEHHPHGFYISRYPIGREATVYWGSLDLRWKNTTPYGVYVQAYRNESTPSSYGSVTVRLWSTKYYEVEEKTSEPYNLVPPDTIRDGEPGCVDQPEGVNGFDIDVTRWIYRNGDLVDEETDHVSYAPEDKIICTNPDD